ncbi:MAG TPA: L,D-transpeptidase [Anaerolineales bacterium]|nr:L,D-transpeptidase [Anaerolineales bacterium]
MTQFSRREFIKLLGAMAISLPFSGTPLSLAKPNLQAAEPILPYGRCLLKYVTVYKRPSVFAGHAGIHLVESILPIYEEVLTEDEGFTRNPRWYRTLNGFVHTSNVQPVEMRFNEPRFSIPEKGTLAEVTVPFVDVRKQPNSKQPVTFRLYYGSTHWVREMRRVSNDPHLWWYAIWDWRSKETVYAPAQALHCLTPDDLAPISPDVKDKHLLVNIQEQSMTAYEGQNVVKTMLISSGRDYTDSGGDNYGTPSGETNVYLKRPSQHMAGGDLAAGDDYDLPGVPWVSFFNGGMAIHGTYWHNDYGTPWSHGCLNVSNADAKWVYRWTSPQVKFDEIEEQADGTRVVVV